MAILLISGLIITALGFAAGGAHDSSGTSELNVPLSSTTATLSALTSSHPFLLFSHINETPGYRYQGLSPWNDWESNVLASAKQALSRNFSQDWNGNDDWVSQRGAYAMNLALAYQITGDQAYAAKAKEALLNIDVGSIPASPPMMRPEAYQDMALLYYCFAYDWAQPDFDTASDLTIRDKLATLADDCYQKIKAQPSYVSFVDWQGQAYPDLGIAGVTLNDYTNPNGLSLSSDPAEWVKCGTDYLFVNDKLHTGNKPLISYEVDSEGNDLLGAYKYYYIDDLACWAQVYTHYYGKNFLEVYPVVKNLFISDVWTLLPDHYSGDYDTNGQVKWDYQPGIVNLLDGANRSYVLNQFDRITASTILPYTQNFTNPYDSSQIPDSILFLVYDDYSQAPRSYPAQNSLLSPDSAFQVMRGSWSDDSDWLSLVTFEKSIPIYTWRNSQHGDQLSFEYYSRGDLLLADGGENKDILNADYGQTEASHNAIAIENPRSPFSASSWADSTARGVYKGNQDKGLVTPASVQNIIQAPWLQMLDTGETITTVTSNDFTKGQALSSPIQYERMVLYPDNDYFIIIDRMEGQQSWGYRNIFRPSSLGITPTSSSSIGHVNGALSIANTSADWQSLPYNVETSMSMQANSITWDTENPYGKNVELQLYTVPASEVLLTKGVGRVAGYDNSSEVYAPVVYFRAAPANDLYRVTALLSKYQSENMKSPSAIPVDGDGNAMMVAAPSYDDYIYTGKGNSTFASFSTDADTAYVRTNTTSLMFLLTNGDFINYNNTPFVTLSSKADYLTLNYIRSKIMFDLKADNHINVTISRINPTHTYSVKMDGSTYSNWAMAGNNTQIVITTIPGEHTFEVS